MTASTPRADAADPGAVRALQTALAAEHAAVYGYGMVGAHLTGSALTAATRDFRRHRARRDALRRMVIQRGATPVAARGAYRLPFAVHDSGDAERLAAYLENAVAAAYLPLVAVDDDTLRRLGATHVTTATERALDWGAKLTAFPGLPSSALR